MLEIERPALRLALREDLAGRGWDRQTGAVDGPLPETFPSILQGTYSVPEPGWFRFVVLPYVHRVIDKLPRVSGVYVCADYVWTAVGLARAYLVDGHGGSILPCSYFGINYRLAVGLCAGGHSTALVYTTDGTYFWDPQVDGGARFEKPLPLDERPGQWGLHTAWF